MRTKHRAALLMMLDKFITSVPFARSYTKSSMVVTQRGSNHDVCCLTSRKSQGPYTYPLKHDKDGSHSKAVEVIYILFLFHFSPSSRLVTGHFADLRKGPMQCYQGYLSLLLGSGDYGGIISHLTVAHQSSVQMGCPRSQASRSSIQVLTAMTVHCLTSWACMCWWGEWRCG